MRHTSGAGSALCKRLWPLASQTLCRQARRRTGLEDFGSPPLEPALSVLTESLEEEAGLRPLGRFLMHAHLRGLLQTRLQLAALWSRQPELAASALPQPVFITGMPRSGSSFLHELMAQDPSNRVPRVWEVMFPVANPSAGARESQRRRRQAAACLWWFRRLAPGADAVHRLRAASPHECVAIQSYSLLSEEFITLCRVPRYEAFLHGSDLGPAYAWERRFLQHLQAGGPSQRWVLKSPDHVFGLESLLAQFPDARIIQTHRHPLEVLKSLTRLNAVLQRLFVPPLDPRESAEREARALAASMERCIHFRDAHPQWADRFIDVSYTELAADPLATVRRLYRELEMPFTDAAAERMRALSARRRRNPRPSVRARGAVPRLNAAVEARRFAHYCARFGISG